MTHEKIFVPMNHISDSLWLCVKDVIYVQYESWVSDIKYDSSVHKFFMSHKYDSFYDRKKIESELPMWVIAMTHLYHTLKLYIWNPNDSDFCVGGR